VGSGPNYDNFELEYDCGGELEVEMVGESELRPWSLIVPSQGQTFDEAAADSSRRLDCGSRLDEQFDVNIDEGGGYCWYGTVGHTWGFGHVYLLVDIDGVQVVERLRVCECSTYYGVEVLQSGADSFLRLDQRYCTSD
jgi:hypothetical protein